MGSAAQTSDVVTTRILPVTTADLGHFEAQDTLQNWVLPSAGIESLHEAADRLKKSNIPVGFPTETVYGLGADATRSDAVRGIYKAKGRPSDNPLIIHVCDLVMLRNLLTPSGQLLDPAANFVPEIYKPLIKAFWPGPLTILLPNPNPSKLAPEVTAGLSTFGVRMPSSPLALSLICLAGVPLAAPSANASTKPSPTTAQHVQHDLDGRIEVILDGGPCEVGVESTVVDGLCEPPLVLRPGGVSIDRIRECEGWEKVVKGYKDASEIGNDAPRAPGMKYKHYSPKAKVVLYEASTTSETDSGLGQLEAWRMISALDKQLDHLGYETLEKRPLIGVITTKSWSCFGGLYINKRSDAKNGDLSAEVRHIRSAPRMEEGQFWTIDSRQIQQRHVADVISISLGKDTKSIAQGLFSALRDLDQRGVDVIYVEGIEDEGDIAGAVMNRLRKAATVIEN